MFFHVDILSKIFSVLTAFVWLMVGIASFEYMAHEKNEQRFYCFYLVVGGVLSALAFSGNLLTMYVFYELMTLTSMPLVMHNLSHEAIMAGLKYLFYSVAGHYKGRCAGHYPIRLLCSRSGYDQRHMGSVYMDHPVCSDNLYGLYDGL